MMTKVNKTEDSLLTEQEQSTLYDALHFMKMAELKKGCQLLLLPDSGKKAELINRIMMFVRTGEVVQLRTIPAVSRAKNYPPQPLDKAGLMLHGSYKNDLRTRMLFKKLIGPHFHFTAFGIDWLNDRWLQGKPPTYQEFADYWAQETERRKHKKAQPKEEWAYIKFLQHMSKTNPSASKADVMKAWKVLQAQNAQVAGQILKSVANKLVAC